MLYIPIIGNINNIVKFLYYLFSFTPFLHNKTVVAMRPFFCEILVGWSEIFGRVKRSETRVYEGKRGRQRSEVRSCPKDRKFQDSE